MPRDPKDRKVHDGGRRITIDLHPRAYDLIQRLLAIGLYGHDTADVVERIVDERLRQYVDDRIVR